MKRTFQFCFSFSVVLLIVTFGVVMLSSLAALRQMNTSARTPEPIARRTRLDTLVVQAAATPTQIPAELIESIALEDRVLINLYQRVNPSVVNIEVTQRTSFFDGQSSSGSGFVHDMDGHIITNAHVISGAAEIQVTFYDGYITTAEIVGRDEYSDIAVIRVNVSADRLVPVILGNSSLLLVGQRVVAIGNPFGLQSSMTRGIISAVGRALPSAQLINRSNQSFNNPSIIQVDAAVNPGNSGGPLLNYNGEVIGINTAIRTDSGTFQGVAFAVPVNTVRRVVPQLIENGRVQYSWLGVSTFPSDAGLSVAALAELFSLPVDYGVIVEDVFPGSPAEAAGLLGGQRTETVRGVEVIIGGDIIVAVNGVFVRDLDQLLGYLVENTSPGDIIALTVIREAETLNVDVKLGTRP